MKKIVRKASAIITLALALTMILSGVLGYLLISNEPRTDHLISKVQKDLLEDKEKRSEKIENAEYGGEITHVEGAAIAEARENYNSSVEEYGIGSVYIPASNISIPLLAGTSEWNLLNGVATASRDQELGEGLFIGMSHNLVNQRLLQDIDQAKKGDIVYLTDFSDVYIYKISEQKVVHETESSYLKEPEDEDEAKLLLYRCEGEFNTDWRRIVYGDYVEKQKLREVDREILNGLMINSEVFDEQEKSVDDSGTNKAQNEKKLNNESKSMYHRVETKIIDKISRIDILSKFSLRVYGLTDSYPIAFFAFILLLFIIYYLI